MKSSHTDTASQNNEARKLLKESALGPVEFAYPSSFKRQLDMIFDQFPERVAIRFEEESITYLELSNAIKTTAQRLRTILGETSGVGIAVRGGLDPQTIIAQLAILYIGGYYFYIEKDRRDQQIRDRLIQSRVATIIDCSRDDCNPPKGPLDTPIPCMRFADLVSNTLMPAIEIQHADQRSGALFYTSGTTGEPKGILFPVDCLMQDVARQTNTIQISAEDRIDMQFSPGFSASLACIYPAILNGASLWISDLLETGLPGLFAFLKQNRITISTMSPSILKLMLQCISPEEQLPHLRLLCSGGDILYRSDAKAMLKHCSPQCVMQNAYASTEARTMTEFLIHRETPIPDDHVSLGWPVEGREIHLLEDEQGKATPNAPKEIVIISRHIPDGYFFSRAVGIHQVDAQTGVVRFHTGDLGYLDESGALHFAGRKDDLLKVRGLRIHPMEIEEALNRHPRVKQSAVVSPDAGPYGNSLVAYIRPSTPPPQQGELRNHLADLLPEYMLPDRYILLDAIPLNANGKIDRRALAARGLDA
jgi:acyl-coenzyme A synthetase/AMP-(fatty) acid ligase